MTRSATAPAPHINVNENKETEQERKEEQEEILPRSRWVQEPSCVQLPQHTQVVEVIAFLTLEREEVRWWLWELHQAT